MEEKRFVPGEKELLKMFIRDIEEIPVLTKEEELVTARRARDGDQLSTDRLIESNLRIVLKVVFRFWYPGLPLMDFVSEGCRGLMRATKTFDPDRGFRFLTYAEYWIASFVRTAFHKYHRHEHYSLDEPLHIDDDETTRKDLLVSETAGVDEMVFHDQVRLMLSELSERERTVIVLRFWHGLTLEETGEKIGLRKERIRQIEARSLRKMRWSNYGSFREDHGETVDITGFAECKA